MPTPVRPATAAPAAPASRAARRPRLRRVLVVVAVVVLALGAAGWWAVERWFFDNPPAPPPLELTPLTDQPGTTAA